MEHDNGASKCLESIREQASRYYSLKLKSRGNAKDKATKAFNQWQACLEVAEEIYHSGDSSSEERIKALKLSIQ